MHQCKECFCRYHAHRVTLQTGEGTKEELKVPTTAPFTLQKMNECSQKNVQTVTMACIVLHNICINHGDSLSRIMDLTIDPVTWERRDREVMRNLLQMAQSPPVRDTCH